MALMFLYIGCSSGGDGDDSIQNKDIENPSTPTNLVANNITSTSTDLSWNAATDNTGIQTYLVFRDGANIASNASTSVKVNDLEPNTTYSFEVQARDLAGNVSGLSNAVSITTLKEVAELQQASGAIETYLGTIIDNVPGSSGNDYTAPIMAQLSIWDLIIGAVLSGDLITAVEKSAEVNYQITEFTDTSLTPNQIFYVLEERSQQVNYWGTYVFSKTPEIENLVLTAPHIKNDINTGKQAIHCFKNNIARAVFISGTHRCNSLELSSCSGTTSTCGSNENYRITDMAHNTETIFQRTTEQVYNTLSNSVFVQLHGFGKQPSDPFVIMSNGTRETPAVDYATLLKNALLVQDNTLTFKLAHIDTDWTRLIGFTNTQSRFINNSSDPCSLSATETSGRFIHIEQERTKLREDESGWSKMSNALGSVFN